MPGPLPAAGRVGAAAPTGSRRAVRNVRNVRNRWERYYVGTTVKLHGRALRLCDLREYLPGEGTGG